MKIGIITYEQFENRRKDSVGSSRLRGTWLMNHWPELERWHISRKYDAMIFQKAYFTRYMRAYSGIKILDLCDPDWLQQRPVVESIVECDAVTVSSQALAEYVRTMTDKPVYYIPDRVDLDAFPDRKVHTGEARAAVWFGYSDNFKMVDAALFTLKRLGLSLTVISETPYYPTSSVQGIDEAWIAQNIKNIKYDQEMIAYDIMEGDMVLNPKSDIGKFKFKSDNKTVIAWTLGMPVAKTAEDMERFMNPENRTTEAEARYQEVQKFWDIKTSVKQYQDIIAEIAKQKNA